MKRSVTLRISDSLHRECAKISRRKKMSMNAFLTESLMRIVEKEKQAMLFDAFTEAADGGCAEFATAAQREILDDE
ncbi:MAG: hypothetical protein ACOX5A_02875 [Aminivibrio sp.]|jgi:predicted transcriptional regulator|nr:hypothetical protein [Synergistaceae bacterium]